MLDATQITALQQYFKTQEKIIAVYLYGSFARGTNNALSDIDLAVMLRSIDATTSQFHLNVIGEINQILQTDAIDVQILSPQSPPVLTLSMLKGQLIYCSNPIIRVSIESQILSRYQDYQPFLNVQLEAMKNRFRKGTYAGG